MHEQHLLPGFLWNGQTVESQLHEEEQCQETSIVRSYRSYVATTQKTTFLQFLKAPL